MFPRVRYTNGGSSKDYDWHGGLALPWPPPRGVGDMFYCFFCLLEAVAVRLALRHFVSRTLMVPFSSFLISYASRPTACLRTSISITVSRTPVNDDPRLWGPVVAQTSAFAASIWWE